MHQALYRKWRPQTFDDVCGQDPITSVLRYETETHSFSHAYLFCGSRGTGKTTCAKILAKAINCESPVNGSPCCRCRSCLAIDSGAATDVLEMDAASNNGVDNIRDIREEVAYSPSALRYRVYIIDEVHMLSVSAFNALLKTLEEPPEHVVFILATTELQKLPATIISRCQRFDFRRISTDDLIRRLSYIATEESIELDEEAARMLAKLAQGGMRDAISLLELCAGAHERITAKVVEETIGLTGRDAMLETVRAVAESDYDALFEQIAQVVRSSKDVSVFWQDLLSVWRDMLIIKMTGNAPAYLDLTDHETEQMKAITQKFGKETLLYHCKLLEDALFAMQKANAVKRIVAEMTLVRMCDASLDTSSEAMLSRIARLEAQAEVGCFLSAKTTEGTDSDVGTQPSAGMEKTDKLAMDDSSGQRTVSRLTVSGEIPIGEREKRILRPIRSWMEVVERISRSAPMTASFVKASRAFTTEDGKVIVRFDNDFALHMMEQDESRDRLRAAVSAVLKREVGDRMLMMETADRTEAKSVIDEIVDASED